MGVFKSLFAFLLMSAASCLCCCVMLARHARATHLHASTLRLDASSSFLISLVTLQCMAIAISRFLDLQLQYLRTLSALSLPHCRSHRTYPVRRVIPKRRSHIRYTIAGVAEFQQISHISWPMYCIAELSPSG
jgi:hypothetical protein